MRKKTRLKKRELTTIALVSLMLFLVFAVASVSAECPAGMVSYWKLDEGSGITAFAAVSTYQNGLNGLGCEKLVVPATIDIDPNTLNPKSKGKWVTAYIELPEGYDVSSIDVGTVMLNDLVPAEPHPTEIGDYDDDGIADLMVKFDRAAVQEILEVGDEVEIIVAGKLTDGTPFEGSDTIGVIDKCKEINFDLSMEFSEAVGTTIADANGLTFICNEDCQNGMTWLQDAIIYDEQYWGEYPLYLPGSMMGVRVTVTNKGKEPEAGFDIECTAFQLNTDGSNGASIMTPQTKSISVANGETKTTDIIFMLVNQAKNLNRFIVSIYTEGTLLMTKEGIFCPPEELKYCEELVVPATIDIDPNTLNPKSKGKWVTAYIELPEGYDVSSIDVGTVMLNDLVPAEPHPTEIGDYDDDGIADLMVKFDRAAVQEILEVGDDVEIKVAGELTDGTPFEGSDTIRVIDKCKEINFDLSMEFLEAPGTTIADANGLTFNIDGETWLQDGIIYDEQYWGEYPLYRPGSDVGVKLTITNKGKEPEAGFDIESTAFQLNTDGSNGASIMTPQIKNINVANGETKTTYIIFPLPLGAKNLNRFIVSIYAEGTLLMTKERIFCPPEELKYCEELVVPATIDIDPNTLNPKSKGKWVTAYIELPEGYDVSSIDVGTVMLNDLVPAEPHPTEIGDYDDDGIADLMVKFDRAAVQGILEVGDDVEIIVAGKLTDGTPFEGSDTIGVIDKCEEINFDLSMEFLMPQGTTIADERGLTFNIDGETWTQDEIIYDEEYWGEYPVYSSLSDVVVKLTITNNGKEPEAGFDRECTAFNLNTDGSNGESIMTPQEKKISVANGETKTTYIEFTLPGGAKNLNRFIVSIYTEGTLLMTKEGIFCPPEELKYCEKLVVPATIDIDPNTLNPKSKGKWVTAYIELPEGYDVSSIDVGTVMLNDLVPAEPHPIEIGDYDDDGIADLMVKFDRAAVQEILEGGDEVEIKVAGELTDGTPFEGSDTIRVIDKCEEINFDLSMKFSEAPGTTIADANGLTFIIDGITLPLVPIIYDEQYWGEYPLYHPGSMMGVGVTITNKGKEPEAGFDIECTAFQLNTDGSNGASIMEPQTKKNISVPNGETITTEMVFPVPPKGNNLCRLIVSIYTKGTLLMTKEGIFCPPE